MYDILNKIFILPSLTFNKMQHSFILLWISLYKKAETTIYHGHVSYLISLLEYVGERIL